MHKGHIKGLLLPPRETLVRIGHIISFIVPDILLSALSAEARKIT